jgi:hypothetical protein
LFKEAVDTWHIAYLEAKLPNITPDKFLKMVDDKIRGRSLIIMISWP